MDPQEYSNLSDNSLFQCITYEERVEQLGMMEDAFNAAKEVLDDQGVYALTPFQRDILQVGQPGDENKDPQLSEGIVIIIIPTFQ